MPDLSTDNPLAVVIVVLLVLLLGGGAGGFVRGVIADRRAKRVDDAALLDMVRDLVREEMVQQTERHRQEMDRMSQQHRESMDHMTQQLRTERRSRWRLEGRVTQLSEALLESGIALPPWPPPIPDDTPLPTD